MEDKEIIIKAIAQRIKDEQKKHEHSIPDWHEIAARKIYASFDIKLQHIEEDVICPKCEGVNEYSISDDGDYRCAYTDCRHVFNKQKEFIPGVGKETLDELFAAHDEEDFIDGDSNLN